MSIKGIEYRAVGHRHDLPLVVAHDAYEGDECAEDKQPWFEDAIRNGDICAIVVPSAEEWEGDPKRRVCVSLASKRTVDGDVGVIGMTAFLDLDAARGMIDVLKEAVANAEKGEGFSKSQRVFWAENVAAESLQ